MNQGTVLTFGLYDSKIVDVIIHLKDCLEMDYEERYLQISTIIKKDRL